MTLSTPSPTAAHGLFHIKAPSASAEIDGTEIESTVRDILGRVAREGDEAVRHYSQAFDGTAPERFEVSDAQKQEAVAALEPEALEDMQFAIEQVRRFAEAQRQTMLPLEIETLPGLHLGHRIIPIRRVGAYVPGGRYPLLSAPVMTIVPAVVAGCAEIVACLPPNAHPAMICLLYTSPSPRDS